MTEIQQLMDLFTFLVSLLLAGLQIYFHREMRRDVRDVRRELGDVRQEVRDARRELKDDLRETQNDVKILINDVGELKGAAGLATTGRGREPVGTGD